MHVQSAFTLSQTPSALPRSGCADPCLPCGWGRRLAAAKQAAASRQQRRRLQGWCALHGAETRNAVCSRSRARVRAQKNIFGNLAWPHATVQLDFRREDGAPVKTATVKAKGSETETLPLFTNKDALRGEVRAPLYLRRGRGPPNAPA